MMIRIVLISCPPRERPITVSAASEIRLFLDRVPDSVFPATNGILHFPFGLVSFAL
jgi:hypothetical protein